MGKTSREKNYIIEFAESELEIMHDVFDKLTRASLGKWTTFIDDGKYGSIECSKQWHITNEFDNIRRKVRIALDAETINE